MKKYFLIVLVSLLSLSIIGCDFFATANQTTITTNSDETKPIEVLLIGNETELRQMDVTKHYQLTADIDLNGSEWEPIGTSATPFSGSFDGNGYTISNYVITNKNDNYNGLFGVASGDIFNLTVENFSIAYNTDFMTYAGGLVGHMTGNISDVTVNGTITITNVSSNTYSGLIVGFHSAYLTTTMTVSEFIPSRIENSSATGSINIISKNFTYAGGVVGKAYNIELKDVNASVDIRAVSQKYRAFAGGLIGHNYSGILVNYEEVVDSTQLFIERCYAESTITLLDGGTWSTAGGLIGYNQYGIIKQSFAKSVITFESDDNGYIGGLIGDDWDGAVYNSVSSVQVIIQDDENDTFMLGVSGLFGSINDMSTSEKGYYYISYPKEEDKTLGSEILLSDLTNSEWYQNILEWDNSDYINKAVILFTQE